MFTWVTASLSIFFLIFLTVYERHSGTVISTHASQQEDPGLDS